jgi:hypothetical protein
LFKTLLSFCCLLLLLLFFLSCLFIWAEFHSISCSCLLICLIWNLCNLIIRSSLNCSQDGEALSTYQDIIYLDFLQHCFEMAYWSNDVMCCSFHIWVPLIAEYTVLYSSFVVIEAGKMQP